MTEYVDVKVYGQTFRLRADAGQEYLKELAAYVDGVMEEMEEVLRIPRGASSQRTAIMAALQIADNYLQLKRQVEGSSDAANKKVSDLIAATDRLLG